MTIKFIVEKRKVNLSGLAPITAAFNKGSLKVRINLGLSVVPDAWDHKEQKLYNVGGQKSAKKINDMLTLREGILIKINTDADLSGIELTPEYVKKRFNELLNPSVKKKVKEVNKLPDFLEMFDYHKEKYKNTKSPEYLRLFKQVKGHLEKFKPRIDYKDLDSNFYSQYMNYLIGEGLQNNTISNHFRKIKVIMNEAAKLKIDIPHDYQDFKNVYKKPKPIWLWPEEIKLLESVELTHEVQKHVRDSFILRFNLGIRFSDQINIKKENIVSREGTNFLNFNSIKTDGFNQIALNKKAMAIIERYDYNLPDYVLQVHNRHLKTICQLAEINEPITKTRFAGSTRIEKILPKWQFIGTHTARRSFARTWADKGGDLLKLSRYLGHSSIEITLDYIGYDNIEVNTEYLRLFDD